MPLPLAGVIQSGLAGVYSAVNSKFGHSVAGLPEPAPLCAGRGSGLRCIRPGLLLCVLAAAGNAQAGEYVGQTIGEAFDQRSHTLLYSETHCVSPDALARKVLYRDREQRLIAHKTLDYQSGPLTPSFVQHNLSSNDSFGVQLKDGEVIVSTTEGEGAPALVALQPDTGYPIVVDAGFDAFVTTHWDSLVAGESRRFQFPLASRETLVEMSIERAHCSYDTDSDQCFSLEPGNWLLRMLADRIELGYDASLQRLTRFRGVSNISDESGSGWVVDIHYRYDDAAGLRCDKS